MKVLLLSPERSAQGEVILGAISTVVSAPDLKVFSSVKGLVEELRRHKLSDLVTVLVLEEAEPLMRLRELEVLLAGALLLVVIAGDPAGLLPAAYHLGPRFVLRSTPVEVQLLVDLVRHYVAAG